jgi:GNAT superfamily N-acetyltransferase
MRAGTLQEMGRPPGTDLIAAQPEDAERLASLSRAAKLSYREWAQAGWEPPSLAAERSRWERRLADPAGWTLIASDASTELGTVHFTNARAERGEGAAIAGRAHLSGLFVLPTKWGQGIGGALLVAALEEMRNRGYREVQLFTAAANRRSRTFYEGHGWRINATNTHRHDDLWLAAMSSHWSAEQIGLGPVRQPG